MHQNSLVVFWLHLVKRIDLEVTVAPTDKRFGLLECHLLTLIKLFPAELTSHLFD